MDNKIELKVLNITNSEAQIGAYALLLGEISGERKLPIIIGPAEAQSIALYLKEITTPRPLTHELFLTSIQALGAFLTQILIYKAVEGVFYSYVFLKKGDETIRIDSRTSDAVALALRSNCPIYIYETILERECLKIADNGTKDEESATEDDMPDDLTDFSSSSLSSLEQALEKAIRAEDYELAARIRDEIKRKKI